MAGAIGFPAYAKAPETSLRPNGRGDEFLKVIQRTPEQIIAEARLGGAVEYAVMNVATGEMLEHSAGAGLPPASVAKALTAAYALEHLGPEFRFRTRILARGAVVDGVLNGDLILAGGGDPNLDTDGLADLAAQVKAAGITKITGDFLVWGGALTNVTEIDAQQPDHVGYNPSISGLNLNFNRVHFEWRKADGDYTVTMEARTKAYRPAVNVAKMIIAERSAPVYTYAARGTRDHWSVARGALGNGGARWLPVRQPELYAGDVFRSLAKGQGIGLPLPKKVNAEPTGAEVGFIESASLPAILRVLLKYSTNLSAEIVGLAASKARLGRNPDNLKASAQEMNLWLAETLGIDAPALVDHSGLGDASRISAVGMAQALRLLRGRLELKPLLKVFALLDKNRKAIPDHPLSVAAKTGTLNFVSGLAGYIDLPDGRELVFAIFAGDLPRRASLSEAQRERPDGGRSWNRRAKTLQQALIERWGVVYAA